MYHHRSDDNQNICVVNWDYPSLHKHLRDKQDSMDASKTKIRDFWKKTKKQKNKKKKKISLYQFNMEIKCKCKIENHLAMIKHVHKLSTNGTKFANHESRNCKWVNLSFDSHNATNILSYIDPRWTNYTMTEGCNGSILDIVSRDTSKYFCLS